MKLCDLAGHKDCYIDMHHSKYLIPHLTSLVLLVLPKVAFNFELSHPHCVGLIN
jgi:hypothetical protein